MYDVVRNKYSAVWLVLVLVTVGAWWFGHGASSGLVAGLFVIVIATVKVSLIGRYFMELNAAPLVLRGGFQLYCLLLGAMLVVMYLW